MTYYDRVNAFLQPSQNIDDRRDQPSVPSTPLSDYFSPFSIFGGHGGAAEYPQEAYMAQYNPSPLAVALGINSVGNSSPQLFRLGDIGRPLALPPISWPVGYR